VAVDSADADARKTLDDLRSDVGAQRTSLAT
jgi:hypothetical protein